MKLKVLNYDKKKAKRRFVLFKFLELFGLFLFIFGFEGLGRFVFKYKLLFGVLPITYFGFWAYGFLTLIGSIVILILIYYICWMVFKLFKAWFKLNWRWAKLSAEESSSKKERKEQQKKLDKIKKIESMDEDREKFGVCEGDKVLIKSFREYSKDGLENEMGEEHPYNKVKIVKSVEMEDSIIKIYLEGIDDFYFIHKEIKKIIKNPIPKKPKLNKIRQKEVLERSKK